MFLPGRHNGNSVQGCLTPKGHAPSLSLYFTAFPNFTPPLSLIWVLALCTPTWLLWWPGASFGESSAPCRLGQGSRKSCQPDKAATRPCWLPADFSTMHSDPLCHCALPSCPWGRLVGGEQTPTLFPAHQETLFLTSLPQIWKWVSSWVPITFLFL